MRKRLRERKEEEEAGVCVGPCEMCGAGAGAERADKDALCSVGGAGRGRRVLHCGHGRAREQGAGAHHAVHST